MIAKTLKRIKRFLFPLKNIIMLESYPTMTDNTKAVFDEMLRRGLNKKYKLVWKCFDDYSPNVKIKNVHFLTKITKQKQLEKYYLKSKALICCNFLLPKYNKEQFTFYLSHGTPIKRVKDYYNIPKEDIISCLVAGSGIKEMTCDQFNFPSENAIALGFPRNDQLTTNPANVKELLNTDCDKVIIWYPTFRQHIFNKTHTTSKTTFPIIDDKNCAQKVNEFAKTNNVLIVIKPHPSQDVSYITDLNLSNIRFINDKFYTDHNVTSYQFVGGCDALVTDYSSIYYDYTLCDKPIAVIWEDIEDYKAKPGLIDDYEFWLKGAEKIYTADEFCSFIKRVATNQDVLVNERREIRDLANVSCNGQNAKRVVDFILSKIEKKKGKTKKKN